MSNDNNQGSQPKPNETPQQPQQQQPANQNPKPSAECRPLKYNEQGESKHYIREE
jgi:hypothetical protein